MGCSLAGQPTREIAVSAKPVEKPQLNLPPVDELNMRPVDWVIITEENLWIQLVHGGNLWNRLDRMSGQLIDKPSDEYLKTHFAL